MLIPDRIRDVTRKSGFRYVSAGGGGRGWQASMNGGARRNGFRGPLRAMPEEAAWDFCKYVDGGGTEPTNLFKKPKAPPLVLKSARHPRASTSVRTDKQFLARRPYLGSMQGYVYLVAEAGNTSEVKVGWSRRSGFARLSELQTGNPRVLMGLAEKPGSLKDEYKLHVRYEPDNVLHEWFEVSDELLAEFDLTADDFKGKVVTL